MENSSTYIEKKIIQADKYHQSQEKLKIVDNQGKYSLHTI